MFNEDTDKIRKARGIPGLLKELEQEAETWIRLTQKREHKTLKSLMTKSGLYYPIISLMHNSKKYYSCGAGLGLVGISASGDVYLCHRFVGREEYKLGSIFTKGLNREEYQKSPTSGSTACSTCFAKYYFAGGCKHDNAGSCGSITARLRISAG
ncbi:SPASM domain-containing protein [Candidatus Contubernalis alkaliaceticus]|uniref:SPASM domain-containing protein n=1 Tax=Candidatus Contubernalis alkaliaceticus TaxID=338645 RepID=UPI001F4C0E7B|nr:SPASM domain-containing protein [Candidatus Contubernalis alkalaceticus]UNC93161.1 SPASM domain-containing protein [Candidatus Contubernalis alkalaceticus]